MKRLWFFVFFILSTTSLMSMLRTSIEVREGHPDAIHYDEELWFGPVWYGPGWYNGVWFDSELEYRRWYFNYQYRRGYWRYHHRYKHHRHHRHHRRHHRR